MSRIGVILAILGTVTILPFCPIPRCQHSNFGLHTSGGRSQRRVVQPHRTRFFG